MMFHKDLFKDWSSSHFVDYGRYLDCPKHSTSSFKILLQERNEPSFQEAILSSTNAQPKGEKNKRISLGNKKGKEQLRLQYKELETSPGSFVEVPLHKNHIPIVDLSAPMDFTPSRPFKTVGPFASLLGTPNIFLDTFRSSQTTPPCPNPIVLPSTRPLGWQCKKIPFSQPSVAMEKHSSTKWPEEYDRISAFIHEISCKGIHFYFPLILAHLPSLLLTFALSCAGQSQKQG